MKIRAIVFHEIGSEDGFSLYKNRADAFDSQSTPTDSKGVGFLTDRERNCEWEQGWEWASEWEWACEWEAG